MKEFMPPCDRCDKPVDLSEPYRKVTDLKLVTRFWHLLPCWNNDQVIGRQKKPPPSA